MAKYQITIRINFDAHDDPGARMMVKDMLGDEEVPDGAVVKVHRIYNDRPHRRLHMRKWTDEQMCIAIAQNKTYAGVMRELGLSIHGGNYRTINNAVKRLCLDTSHMTGQAHGTSVQRKQRSLDEIMVEDSTYNPSHLKEKIMKLGILPNKCATCDGPPEWKGKPLVMVLDHINGKSNDHRKENLRLLCPNCNSQTSTFSRRKKA